MAADGFPAGKTADGLVYHSLENGGGKVFFGGALIDQRLDVCLGEHTAAGCNGIEGFVILCVLIQPRSICLQQRSHLVNKRAGTAGADTIHTLFNISTLKVNDLCILTAQFYGHVGFGCQFL